ncbi:MAG TPA: hypothetical protein VKB88_23830 [Bryobacteraceae bacterium]|nr:hypothetical protein [Bryobacteraceae bacterium]
MTYTQSKTSTSSQSAATASTSTSSTGCGCGCHEHPHTSECCKLTCFERPVYFCGQLLSDADLTLQENYFREKNKLYHRTIDGYGVVCGLRMKCDGTCDGHIAIGEGYAIDCCGNDLVVCEPKSYDVIGALRAKKWLLESPEEPCDKKPGSQTYTQGQPRSYTGGQHNTQGQPQTANEGKELREHEYEEGCLFRQCFYIGICYAEEASTYVTPYTTDCTPGPGPCQPTRIRECVSFEVYDELPCRPNPLKEIEKRIERCFRMFREGQFARWLREFAPEILRILRCDQTDTQTDDANRAATLQPDGYALFVQLRAQFLHQLRICPDQYNCNLEREVCRLRCPSKSDDEMGPTALEAFTKLFMLIEKYVFSCVLAEFAFLCPDPPDPCCVLIGAVEVENGRLTRVINYPRWYMWCFANFFEVLIYTLANDAACSRTEENTLAPNPDATAPPPPRRPRDGCCPEPEVDVCEFLNLFVAENRFLEYAARTSTQSIGAVYRAMVDSFDFTKPHGVAPAVFNGLSFADAQALAKKLNFTLNPLGEPLAESRDPVSAFLANAIHRGPAPMSAFEEVIKDVSRATGATRILDAPALAVGSITADYVEHLEARIAKLEAALQTQQNPPANPPAQPSGETK